MPFLPTPPPHPTWPTCLTNLHRARWFCPCVLYTSSCNPLFPLSPTHSPLAIVRLFLTSMSLVIFCFLFSSVDYIPVKGEITWYLSLTTWVISLHNALQFHPCCCKGYKLLLSLCCIEFHCVNIPSFLDPLICWWALRLLPVLGYCKLRCYEHWGAQVLLDWCFRVLRV